MFSEFVRIHIRAILITILLIVVAAIAAGIYFSASREGKIAVTVAVVPSDAHTTVDGQSVSSGTIYLKPGSYTVTSKKDGFADYSEKQQIEDNQSSIVVSLTPESADAKKWADDHNAEYLANESLAGQAADTFSNDFRDKNPIVNVLPYDNYIFTIGYENDQSDPTNNSVIITIDAPEGYRNAAIDQIRSLGYDPTTLNIKFRNYTDPFAS
jgi:DNA-binding MarR family transcriptional regulator